MAVATSSEDVYSKINIKDVAEYHAGFQVIQSVWTNHPRTGLLARIKYNSSFWRRKGGVYAIQILDGVLQLGYLSPAMVSRTASMYAGKNGHNVALSSCARHGFDLFI